ncbi:nucleic acid-binding protein [Trichodelitschia bisporula]|uniref:rRNA biogenesis protein RRP5 n=1 Tax=Trichodelitschia bisporula TaxID=703511 RepID=A0A6G1HST0_9PEZI|nr:nucleic acid-binding protein [Trichodelitschia bisporula]
MAPIKRAAENDAGRLKPAKHSTDNRPAKRQRQTEKQSSDSRSPAAKFSKTEPSKEAPAKDAVSVLRLEEKAFPRGGASVLTPIEHKQIQHEATRDVLFEQSGGKPAAVGDLSGSEDDEATVSKKSKKKVKKGKGKEREDTKEKSERLEKIQGLSFKRLTPGSLVLGQITQITSKDLALALPNNITGYVPLTEISDTVTQKVEKLLESADKSEDSGSDDFEDVEPRKLFRVGQYLRAYVISNGSDSTKSRKRIELSLIPRLTNVGLSAIDLVEGCFVQAAVVSVEDYGFIMDLGLEDKNLKAFLSSKMVPADTTASAVEEGSVFLCFILGKNADGSIVKLCADHQKIANLKKNQFLSTAPSINVFLPGTSMNMTVTDVSSSGLRGQVMGMLDVTSDMIHSGAAQAGKPLHEKLSIGQKVKARVLFKLPKGDSQKIGVSLLDHALTLSAPSLKKGKSPVEQLPIATIVESAKVVRVEPTLGLFMDVGVPGIQGFAHISRLTEKKIDMLSTDSGSFKEGSTHRARVIGFNPTDGLFLMSLEERVLEQPYLRVEDIPIGQVVKGTVEKLLVNEKGVGGILVTLAEGITGLVPEMHMADVHLQHPERKFRDGMAVTARVLSTNPEKRTIRLTLKKTLVNSDVEPWTSYEAITPGAQAPGTLVNILDNGAVVQFYGSIRGFLPVAEMSEAFIANPKEHFRVGQVVTVRAINVDAEKKKLTLTCKDQAGSDESRKAFQELKIGQIVSGTVTEVSPAAINLELEGGLKGILKNEQLTDGSENKNVSAAKKTRVGQKLHDVVILEKADRQQFATLSSKPSLVKAAKEGHLPSTIRQVEEGKTLAGFVRNITGDQVFVQFGGRLVGLLLKTGMSEEMKNTESFGLRVGQSLSARVLSIDHSRERFLLTLREDKAEAVPKENTRSGQELVKPVDGKSKTIADFALGKHTVARVKSVKDVQLNVVLADNVQGRIHISELFTKWEDITDPKHPLKQFKVGQLIPVRILGIHDARTHRFLPISHRTGTHSVYELTAKVDEEDLTIDNLALGSTWIAFINNFGPHCAFVSLSASVHGSIDLMDLSSDSSLLGDLATNFPVGSALQARVKAVEPVENKLRLTATPANAVPLSIGDLNKGQKLSGRITKITDRSLIVQLSEALTGTVTLTELADDYSQANTSAHKKNDIVQVVVVDFDVPNKKVFLSLRPSLTQKSAPAAKDRHISSATQLKVNDVVRGFVKNVADVGLFVALGPRVTGFVRVAELSDSYIKDWKASYEVDQLVRGKVTAIDEATGNVQLSLRASVLDKDYVPLLTIDDLKKGMIVTGKVRKVEDFGVFIVVDNSRNVSGLCHRSEIANGPVSNVKQLYDEGDAVKALVLQVDKEKRRVSFGLKASYFKHEGDESSDEEGGVDVEMGEAEDDDSDVDIDLGDVKSAESDNEDGAEDSDASSNDDDNVPRKGGLNVGGFDWTGAISDGEQEANDSEAEQLLKKKKHKKPTIQEDRTGDLDRNGPQSVADFERLLLGQPNSSSLWIQYMAFQLSLSEVDKARAIGDRALKTINMLDQDEKMNVWIALLNLENAYGSPETLEEVFTRACQYSDKNEMHSRLASIYIESGKNEEAAALFTRMHKLKDLTATPTFWLNHATFLMTTQNQPDAARALLARATQSVPKQQHRQLVARFGALEYTSPHGDVERGRTVFEGLLDAYTQVHRWDLWDMYLDLETSKGEMAQARGLFERMAKRPMKTRRARYFFKRWAKFEEEGGDKKALERVQALAKEWVEKHAERKEDEDVEMED